MRTQWKDTSVLGSYNKTVKLCQGLIQEFFICREHRSTNIQVLGRGAGDYGIMFVSLSCLIEQFRTVQVIKVFLCQTPAFKSMNL